MRRVTICFGLLFGLLTFFTLNVSAQSYKFRFNVISDVNKPESPRVLNGCDVAVVFTIVTDDYYKGRKRDSDLMIINHCDERSYSCGLSDVFLYSTKKNSISFVDEDSDDFFQFLILENEVVFVDKRTKQNIYMQTNDKLQKDNLGVFNRLMTQAKSNSIRRYSPICED
ncbi:MAG: hypothetical protein IJV44_09335 [Prevotella sp.]|nr:hypothetical protein [Prevotella sp.]